MLKYFKALEIRSKSQKNPNYRIRSSCYFKIKNQIRSRLKYQFFGQPFPFSRFNCQLVVGERLLRLELFLVVQFFVSVPSL